MRRITTASQTIGPYWHLIEDKSWSDLTRFGARKAFPDREVITLRGQLTDGDGLAFPEACVELWQSDPEASALFPAFGRAATDRDGIYTSPRCAPARCEGAATSEQAPHFALCVLARGLMRVLGDPRLFPE